MTETSSVAGSKALTAALRGPQAPAAGIRPLRVLHIIQNLNYGGMERLLADLVHRVDPKRFETHVLVLQYLGRFADGLREVATLHDPPRQSRLSMIRPAALTRVIRDIAPDVVHTHSGVWYKASLAARRAGVPRLIHTDHGRMAPDPWLWRRIDRLASARTDLVVAVSRELAEHMAAQVVRDPSKLRTVVNGVDTELHRPMNDNGVLRGELGIPADVPIIGSIGRLEPIKGYVVMVQALAQLEAARGERPMPHLVVAGDGSERARLLTYAAEVGLRKHVHLLGWRDDVRDLHCAFSIFSISSHSEGTSVSLLEAMSAGRCPVVTRVGGNASVLGDRLSHRLVPPSDPDALAKAWIDALDDHDRRVEDGAAARSRVSEAFSLDSMVRSYEELYSGA